MLIFINDVFCTNPTVVLVELISGVMPLAAFPFSHRRIDHHLYPRDSRRTFIDTNHSFRAGLPRSYAPASLQALRPGHFPPRPDDPVSVPRGRLEGAPGG